MNLFPLFQRFDNLVDIITGRVLAGACVLVHSCVCLRVNACICASVRANARTPFTVLA